MTYRLRTLPALALAFWVAGVPGKPLPLIATGATQSLLHNRSGGLTIRVFGFSGLSPWVLQGAEAEAARMLRSASIELNWIDCTAQVSGPCVSSGQTADLIVRFLPKALPGPASSVLGVAGLSGDSATAFIFYDRIAAIRTHTRLLPVMLGRVMAHEITHLLLPEQGHAELGLMRAEWWADDLEIVSRVRLGLPAMSVRLMQTEVRRRALARAR